MLLEIEQERPIQHISGVVYVSMDAVDKWKDDFDIGLR